MEDIPPDATFEYFENIASSGIPSLEEMKNRVQNNAIFKNAENHRARQLEDRTSADYLKDSLTDYRTVPLNEDNPPQFLAIYPGQNYADMEQWKTIVATVEALGGEITLLNDPDYNYFNPRDIDHYTQDPLAVFPAGKVAFIPQSGRYYESTTDLVKAELVSRGYEIVPVPGKGDGGDFTYSDHHKLIVVGGMFEQDAMDIIKERTGYDVLKLDSVSEWQELPGQEVYNYHVDTFLRFLPGGEVLYSGGLTEESYHDLVEKVGEDTIIEVPDNLATNLTIIGSTLLMSGDPGEDARTELEKQGYKIVTPAEIGPGARIGMEGGAERPAQAGTHCVILGLQPGEAPTFPALPDRDLDPPPQQLQP